MKRPTCTPTEIKEIHENVGAQLSATLPEVLAIARQLRVISDTLPKEIVADAQNLFDMAIDLHVALEAHVKKRYPGEALAKAYEIKMLSFDPPENEVDQ